MRKSYLTVFFAALIIFAMFSEGHARQITSSKSRSNKFLKAKQNTRKVKKTTAVKISTIKVQKKNLSSIIFSKNSFFHKPTSPSSSGTTPTAVNVGLYIQSTDTVYLPDSSGQSLGPVCAVSVQETNAKCQNRGEVYREADIAGFQGQVYSVCCHTGLSYKTGTADDTYENDSNKEGDCRANQDGDVEGLSFEANGCTYSCDNITGNFGNVAAGGCVQDVQMSLDECVNGIKQDLQTNCLAENDGVDNVDALCTQTIDGASQAIEDLCEETMDTYQYNPGADAAFNDCYQSFGTMCNGQ